MEHLIKKAAKANCVYIGIFKLLDREIRVNSSMAH